MKAGAWLQKALDEVSPERYRLIKGAGKFGTMFLAQAPTTEGLEVAAIADLDLERARASCRAAGWDEARIARTTFLDSGTALAEVELDVVVEATGNPLAGVRHARAAFARRRHGQGFRPPKARRRRGAARHRSAFTRPCDSAWLRPAA